MMRSLCEVSRTALGDDDPRTRLRELHLEMMPTPTGEAAKNVDENNLSYWLDWLSDVEYSPFPMHSLTRQEYLANNTPTRERCSLDDVDVPGASILYRLATASALFVSGVFGKQLHPVMLTPVAFIHRLSAEAWAGIRQCDQHLSKIPMGRELSRAGSVAPSRLRTLTSRAVARSAPLQDSTDYLFLILFLNAATSVNEAASGKRLAGGAHKGRE
jgi:hypothetical protein